MKAKLPRIFLYVFLFFLSFIWWIPFIWSVAVSFKPVGALTTSIPSWVTPPFTLENYQYIFNNPQADILLWMANSIITASISTACIVVLAAMAGYAFSKFQFHGKSFWFWIIMAGMMIPFQSLLIPMYIMFNRLGMLNTYAALILPYLGSSFGVILMKQFIDSLPSALFDAARIDGCSSARIFRSIVLPLVRPALASLCIFVFLQQWNDFLWPFISITKQEMMTIPIGIVLFRSQTDMDKAYALGANVIAITPVLLVFLFFQKNIVKGVTLSGIKG